ncbi:MAG: hypothetical protein NWF10_01600 [Candidatus Bathyarchaeota archaeon]|nr:hypothetical protein [Candidatus Bathyarchaeota archaeon]
MPERLVNLQIKEIYSKVKQILVERDYLIIVDEPYTCLSIKQGSIWGIMPRTAKKIINYSFRSMQSGTRIHFYSSFAPEWKYLTVIGYVLSFFLVGLSLWINMDLENYILSGNASFWSWIVTSANSTGFSSAQSFSDLARMLALFLILVVLVETLLVIYSHFKINDIAEEILNQLE